MNLDEMPLDSKKHILLAFHMVTGMQHRIRRAAGQEQARPLFMPGDDELAGAMSRIRAAAAEAGIELGTGGEQ